jgi:predicted dehydrogenase
MSESTTRGGMDRRTFLKSTATIGAGLAFAPGLFAQTAGGGANDINVALLGAGEQGKTLMAAALKIPNVRFKAVCDIWEAYNQRAASRTLKALGHENTAYVDYREMLDKEKGKIDAVLIATPDFWHSEHTVACLEAGLHVYCEKEMSNTLEGARKMVEAQKKTGKLLQIGHQRRSNPRYIHCYEKLLSDPTNALGRITAVSGQWNRSARDFDAWPKNTEIPQATLEKYGFKSMQQFRNWRWFKGLGGGPIVDLGSHQIDIYSWFLRSRPRAVMASGGTDYYDKQTHEWYDTVMTVFEYPSAKGTIRAYYQVLTTNGAYGYFELFMGDQGTLEISESASRGAVYPEPGAELADRLSALVKQGLLSTPKVQEQPKAEAGVTLDVRETPLPPAFGIPVSLNNKPYHQPHLENFFDAIQGKAKLNCPAEVGYETAVTVLKVNEAVEAAKRLEFKPEEFRA